MLFNRTFRFQTSNEPATIKSKLVGKHVRIHNLDFEVYEKDSVVKIIPHDEQETAIKTLPITDVLFNTLGDKTQVVVKTKIREIDSGGPWLIIIFSVFLIIAAFVIMYTSKEIELTYALFAISVVFVGILWFRLATGYFDYVRKIRNYVKKEM
jgi:hypothetical protein